VLNGLPAIRFDGSDDNLVSIAPASDWTHGSDGSGFEAWTCIIPRAITGGVSTIWGTYTSGAQSGITTIFSGANAVRSVGLRSTDGAITYDVTSASLPSSVAVSMPLLIRVSYSEAASPKAELWFNNTQVATSGSAVAPTGAPPAASLNLGRRANGTANSQLDWFEDVRFARILTAAERTNLWTYFQTRYAL
jgi:hypothetical protein